MQQNGELVDGSYRGDTDQKVEGSECVYMLKDG